MSSQRWEPPPSAKCRAGAPPLENLSRDRLGLIGLWLIWNVFFRLRYTHGEAKVSPLG